MRLAIEWITPAVTGILRHPVDNIFNHINDLQNKSNGRDVWLTEFSVVDWSGGSGNWSEESNYNFILEFLWRAESKNNLDKYAIFLFSGGSPTNPWDLTNPRSNFFSGGSLTPFGKAYAAWDGDTTIHDYRSYVIHNRNARHRLKNDGSATLTQDTIRNEDESVQWYFEDAGSGKKYITSILDGKRLRFDGAGLDYAPKGTIGVDVEWTIQREQYGWHNIIHSGTGQYLRLVRSNDANNAPTSLNFEMVSAAQAAGYTSTDWHLVSPWNATQPPNTSGPGVSNAAFNANTDQSFDVTFATPIDATSIGADDFVFQNTDYGFTLTGGDLFVVNPTGTSVTIQFRDLPLLSGNWQFDVVPGSITDTSGAGNPAFTMPFTLLNGDADFDGDVDGTDFLTWQRGNGTLSPTGTADQGDADHDLDVDSADLAIWRSGYGSTIAILSAIEAGPQREAAHAISEEASKPQSIGLSSASVLGISLELTEPAEEDVVAPLETLPVDQGLAETAVVRGFSVSRRGEYPTEQIVVRDDDSDIRAVDRVFDLDEPLNDLLTRRSQ